MSTTTGGEPGRGPAAALDRELRGLARGGLGNVAGAVAAAASGIGVILVITRTLPGHSAGVLFAGTSLFLIAATVSRLGTPTGLVYVLSGNRAEGRPATERATLRLALVPALVTSTILAAVLAAAAPAVVELLGLDAPDSAAVLRLLALLLPVAVVSDVVLAATRGLGTMRPTIVNEYFGRSAVQFLLVLLAAVTVGSAPAIALAWCLPYAASALLAWRRFRSLTPPSLGGGSAADRHRFWAFTWPRAVASVVQIALQRLDIVLVAVLLGPTQAAVYTAASRFLVVGQLGNAAVSTAAQPRLRAALASGETARAQSLYRAATGWLILVNWPLYLLAMIFADPMLNLFGPEYLAGRPVVLVLGAATLVGTACGMVDMLLTMGGRSSWNLYNSLAALAVNVSLDLLLIPRLGILGAAIGWAAAILLNNLVPLAQIGLVLRMHPVTRGTVTAVLLSVACFAGLPSLGLALTRGDLRGAAVGAVLGAAGYVAGCALERRSLALPEVVGAVRRGHRRGAPQPGAG
ncbi:MAG: lipopolysaccharide biosynthesis protein [Mycobacteriales bacterium]